MSKNTSDDALSEMLLEAEMQLELERKYRDSMNERMTDLENKMEALEQRFADVIKAKELSRVDGKAIKNIRVTARDGEARIHKVMVED